MSQITVENLSIGYDGKAVAEGLSFCVGSGDYVSVIGENGAGKSTLLKTVLSLQKPLRGSIRLGDGIKRRDFGYLPQQRETQKDFPASVYEIVLSGFLANCGLRPFYNKKEKAAAAQNMERLGIAGLSKRCYRELSGGQRQRVLLARALCAGGKVLFLDEPASGLDPSAAETMYALTESLNREYGISVVTVSHDIEAALKYSSHILRIDKNKGFFFGTKNEFTALRKTEETKA
jgi:zinc transport system ATP-binding protein